MAEIYSDIEMILGQKIYEDRYSAEGGVWSGVEPREVWYDKAREMISIIADLQGPEPISEVDPEPYLITAHVERCASAFLSGFSTVSSARIANLARAVAKDRDEIAARLESLTSDRLYITGHNEGYNLAIDRVYEAFTDTTPTHTAEVEAFADRLQELKEPKR